VVIVVILAGFAPDDLSLQEIRFVPVSDTSGKRPWARWFLRVIGSFLKLLCLTSLHFGKLLRCEKTLAATLDLAIGGKNFA